MIHNYILIIHFLLIRYDWIHQTQFTLHPLNDGPVSLYNNSSTYVQLDFDIRSLNIVQLLLSKILSYVQIQK
jgi:hypothetical protein